MSEDLHAEWLLETEIALDHQVGEVLLVGAAEHASPAEFGVTGSVLGDLHIGLDVALLDLGLGIG